MSESPRAASPHPPHRAQPLRACSVIRAWQMRTDAVQPVEIPSGADILNADLRVPSRAVGLVIFAHGSGSSRFSRRNRQVAGSLEGHGFATLLLDLLTPVEDTIDQRTAEYRFDIERLGPRVSAAVDWAGGRAGLRDLSIGCFGASTGAAAALIAAAERPDAVRAVVSRGGRPDLAGNALRRVLAPTLLIVGGHDEPVIEMNRDAMRLMRAEAQLEIVPGATHLFEEPGTLEQVERLAAAWFSRHLRPEALDSPGGGPPLDSVSRGPCDFPRAIGSIPPVRRALGSCAQPERWHCGKRHDPV